MVPSTGVHEPQRAAGQFRLVEGAAPLSAFEPVEHRPHPAFLFAGGHLRRDQHDRSVTLAIRGDGPAAARRTAHFDGRVGGSGPGGRPVGAVRCHVNQISG